MLKSLDEAMAEASSLMVTHRLDQLGRMDEILVLDRGSVVQKGSFQALSRTPGLFRQMQKGELDGPRTHAGEVPS